MLASLFNSHGPLSLDRSTDILDNKSKVHALSSFLIIPSGMPLLFVMRHTISHQKCTNNATFSYSLLTSIILLLFINVSSTGVPFHPSDLGLIYSKFYQQLKPCSWTVSSKNASKTGVFKKNAPFTSNVRIIQWVGKIEISKINKSICFSIIQIEKYFFLEY